MTETTTKRRRGPYAKSAARRQDILRTALQVFGEQGYRGSSMREIAQRVGMSESGLLHHFGGKVELLLSVLEERDNLSRPQGVVSGNGPGLVLENSQQPGVVRLFATLSAEATDPDHPAHRFFVERYSQVRADLVEALRHQQAGGRISPDIDPALAAQLVLAVMDGLQIQWLLDPAQDMVAAYRHFHRHFLATGEEGRPEQP